MKHWLPSAVRPGGTVDNSPALQCWVTVEQRFNSPGGTTEPAFWRRLNRPSGTFGLIGLRHPAINRWAFVKRPSRTETDVARRMRFSWRFAVNHLRLFQRYCAGKPAVNFGCGVETVNDCKQMIATALLIC